MKPIIGIVSRFFSVDNKNEMMIRDDYRRTIIDCGGIPMVILPTQSISYVDTKYRDQNELSDEEKEMLNKELSVCDGFLFPGGGKINNFDIYIRDYAIEHDIPILGICLGMQIISNYGRDIYNKKIVSDINHNVDNKEGIHFVNINTDSMLYRIVGSNQIYVNSYHNFMAVNNDKLKVVAKSLDGVIEAVEMPGKKFVLGVQWHPEKNYDIDEYSKIIIESFISASLNNTLNNKK